MSKTQCLIVEDAREMGGVQYSTYYLSKYFINHQSIEIEVLIPGDGPFYQLCVKAGIKVSLYKKYAFASTSIPLFRDRFRLPNIPGFFWNVIVVLKQVIVFKRIFKSKIPQLIITKGIHAHVCGSLAARIIGIPSIWHLQDLISQRFAGIFRSSFGLMARLLPKWIFGEEPMIAQLPASVSKKSDIVLNGIDLDSYRKPEDRQRIREELKIPADGFVIGHAARLIPWKGQHLLLEAFKEYAAARQNVYLVLVGAALFTGKKYEESLRQFIAKNKLEKRVIMTGHRSDLGSLLAAMDVFIYPSVEKDTMPLSLIAAWAAALPVAVSNLPGLVESVSGNKGTVIFENKNIAGIVRAIELFEDPTLRNESGRLNSQWAEKYGLARYGHSVETVLQKMVSI